MRKNRNIDHNSAQQKKYLHSGEVLKLLKKIGEPIAPFGKVVVIENTRMSRYALEGKIPFLNGNEFRRLIISIIMENRDLGFKVARYTKQLHTNEVMAFLDRIGEPVKVRKK